MSVEGKMAELRKVLELPTVGRLRGAGDLAELRRLIEQYEAEARKTYAEIHGPI